MATVREVLERCRKVLKGKVLKGYDVTFALQTAGMDHPSDLPAAGASPTDQDQLTTDLIRLI